MATTETTEPTIVRTERGLTLSGTRLTVYDVYDLARADWERGEIRDLLGLSDAQIDVLLVYIEQHRAEVEADYREIERQSDEIRRYWEDRNREWMEQIAGLPSPPGQENARARLRAWRERLTDQE